MKLSRGKILGVAVGLGVFALALGSGAIFGALGRHSGRFPLNIVNHAADSVWSFYEAMTGDGPDDVPTGADVTFSTIFTPLRGQVFQIPLSRGGGEGGAMTSVGNAILLMTHDGRFFAGSADAGFRQIAAIAPPDNGLQAYTRRASRAPYDPDMQNFANYRYNGIAAFHTAAGAGLLISYTFYNAERDCYATRVSRYDFPDDRASAESLVIGAQDWRVLFETSPCLPLNEAGQAIHVMVAAGRLVVENATGTVYLASGSYDAANPNSDTPLAQDPGNDYGKVLAINIATGRGRDVSRGHRNPQGLAQDAAGRLWTVEHGPRGGDELNRIVAGRNYGWPLAVYGSDYDQRPYPTALTPGRHDGFEQPTLAWLPSIGPGTVMAIRGFHPTWDGDLLVGALVGQKLLHIRIVDNRVAFAEEISVGRRVRYLHQHTDGSIALWNGENELIILTPGEQSTAAQSMQTVIANLDAPERIRSATRTAIGACMQCHSLESGDNANAPSLAGVFGANIASSGFSHYSSAMMTAEGDWSRQRLDDFLRDPDAAIPGTNMPDQGLGDAQVRAGVIEALAALRRESGGS
jgi:cytochrome c2